MKNLKFFEIAILVFLAGSLCFGLYAYFTDTPFFETLIAEDSFYENLTSIFLFFCSFLLFIRLFQFQKGKTMTWKIGILLMTVGLFFGAGEEISWGQRIFDVQSSDFFKQNNAQQETNLHNMVVGEVKLNKLIFSNLMSIVFGIYFLVVPILYKKSPKLKSLINGFGVSVPKVFHIAVFVIATVLILGLIDHHKKWEIWEFVFALMMFLIIYNPWNKKEIFSK